MSDYLKMLEQQEALRRAAEPLRDVRSQIDTLALAGALSQIDVLTLAGASKQIDVLALSGARSQIDALHLTSRPDISILAGSGAHSQLDAIHLASRPDASALAGLYKHHLSALKNPAGYDSLLHASAVARDALSAWNKAAGIDRSFVTSLRYPGLDESISLARQAIKADRLVSQFFKDAQLQSKMLGMNHPWLRPDAAGSALGFAAMQAMGGALDRYEPFATDLSSALRKNLGDWRDIVQPPLPTMLDTRLRSGFYHERGFNPSLTAFSEGAFADSAELAGLIVRRRPVEADTQEVDEDEIAFQRNREAFDQIQRFETAIRRFIDARMRSVFGEKWVKQQTPRKMYEGWLDKKEKAIKAGEPERPLIEYADFSDYRIIIERSDNWTAAFQPIFVRVEDVRESLQRLQPVRIATMHTRWITLEDEALLIFETKRLLKAFAKS